MLCSSGNHVIGSRLFNTDDMKRISSAQYESHYYGKMQPKSMFIYIVNSKFTYG